MFRSLKRLTTAAAVGFLRGSGPKVNHAFASRPGDRPELVVWDRVAGHHLCRQALVAHLPKDQPRFGVVPADINHIDRRCLEARYEGVEVSLPLGVGLVELLLHAGLVEGLLGLVSKAFAVSRLVVKNGDVLATELPSQIRARNRPLLVVAAAHPKRVP